MEAIKTETQINLVDKKNMLDWSVVSETAKRLVYWGGRSVSLKTQHCKMKQEKNRTSVGPCHGITHEIDL
jgi:hypothetical protein